MRKGLRVTLDLATQHAVEQLARAESRPVSNMCLALIKSGLAAKRAEQRPISEPRSDDRS
jgi:hypothetical protein